jgi:tetratricopeptide (TPR) repeat protein
MNSHPARVWTRRGTRALLYLALLLFFTVISAGVAAARPKSILDDEQFRTEVRQGLDRLYDMDYAGANAAFAEIEKRYPDHPVGPFLRSLQPWWEILVDPDDDSHDDAFFGAMDQVIQRCDRRLRADPQDLDGMFFKAGALAFRGRLHTDRKNWLRAALDGRKALQLLEDVRKRDPENPDLLLGVGLFDYLADVAPVQYPILKHFTHFFPKGSRERGLQEISQAVEKGQFVQAEAAFCLVQINYIFEKDYATSLHYARWLRDRYPDNALFHVYEGRALARLNLWPDEHQDILDVLARQAEGKTGYRGDVMTQAIYVLGRDDVRWRQYGEAIPILSRLEGLASRSDTTGDYKAYGRLYRAMALDALGRRDEAVYWYNRAMAERPPGEVRDKARSFLRAPYQG